MATTAAPSTERRPHRFLARTFSTGRWSEYDELLRTAVEEGWVVMDFEDWVRAGGLQGRVLILRHDVDQHPATALRMARIEARHAVNATWYFRWRTSSAAAIERIREMGGHVGLHYETLTRFVRERGLSAEDIDDALIEEARVELRREIEEFNVRFGPIASICAHGDTRVPGVSNQVLAHGVEPSWLGVEFDAGEALRRHRLGVWLTDRIAAEGRWKDGADPLELVRTLDAPILCLTHPNNWCSGVSLWSDRLKASVLRPPAGSRAMRTGEDAPPRVLAAPPPSRVVARPELRPAAPVRPVDPIAVALRREIVRHYYETGKASTSSSVIRTIDTNSSLAESRVQTLERVLEAAGLPGVRDRRMLDLGAGFGALALVFAARGARVTALDPNRPRLEVGGRVAEQFQLPVRWMVGRMDTAELGEAGFDVVVMNNSFCYLVDYGQRHRALERALHALRPGGVLVIRNPKRMRLRDQFTGLPFVGMLSPGLARLVLRLLGRERSHVRLVTRQAAKRELRRAGFCDVMVVPVTGRGRLAEVFASYQHLAARRPA